MKKLLILLIIGFPAMALAQRPSSGGPLNELQAAMDIKYYELDLKVDPETKTLAGSVKIVFQQLSNQSHWELDLVSAYKIESIISGKKSLSFKHENGKISIPFDRSLVENGLVKLTVKYGGLVPIAPNPPWEGGFTFEKSPNGNHWIGLSCQNDGADIFMPCKDQPSDKPDSVRMSISVPFGYQAIGNGLLESVVEVENEQSIYTWFTQYPINNYSINFTIGKFANYSTSYTSVDNNPVKVDVYLLEENEDKLQTMAELSIDNLKHHEQYFGEYPFAKEKFGLVETPYLGMEHQTINAYGNEYRFTVTQGKTYDWLLLHELGHEWWANKVTASDWADFWIHEGICAFSDALYLYTKFGWDEYWKKMSQTRNNVANQKPIVMGRQVNSVAAYHPDIYGKGAFVLHMLWQMLGDDLFFGILYDLANTPESTYLNGITTEYFVNLVNKKSGEDYTNFFAFFMNTTEIPEVIVREGEDGEYSISIPNINFSIPMEVHTADGVKIMELSKQPISILTNQRPTVDPEGIFLRKVVNK